MSWKPALFLGDWTNLFLILLCATIFLLGIIGLGDVCTKKSGPAFYKCDGSELVAVMRRTTGMAKAFAKTVPGGKCVGYEDIDAFLQHPSGLDVVYVSTRPGTHLEICTMVASAGIACYVEKPVGRCALETERISKIFKEAGLPLYTAYISRAYEKTQCKWHDGPAFRQRINIFPSDRWYANFFIIL